MKQIFYTYIILSLFILLPDVCRAEKPLTTIRQQMKRMHRELKVNFIYDASIDVDCPYRGKPLTGLPLKRCLTLLFADTEIEWTLKDNYIILTKKKKKRTEQRKETVPLRHTLNGYIRDTKGETLINATVFDKTTGTGTMTNEHGYFSLTLPEGQHNITMSYIGYKDVHDTIMLYSNKTIDVSLIENANIAEIVVTGNLNSPILTTQTGKRSLTSKDLKTEFALFSSPDVVKSLQRISGVAEGIEITSGLYVHGGNNDENLFLLDGTPLYHTNHTLGVFSSFNTDVVKNVDFYKSGFPARYGGRLSSVIDVRTNDGNMNSFHSSYSIGLLDGRFQVEGPICKGKTSFNFGIRRSWIDILSKPIFAIINHNNKEEKFTINYHFHDINGKITHLFNNRNKISLSIYSGHDALRTKDRYEWKSGQSVNHNVTETSFKWGNFNAALDWNIQLSPKLFANFTAVCSYYNSIYDNYYDDRTIHNGDVRNITYTRHGYRSTIYDVGYRTEFDYRPIPKHHIRFGNNYTYHMFRPQTYSRLDIYGSADDTKQLDSVRMEGRNYQQALETNLYIEDEFTVNRHWSLNAGLHFDTFYADRKTFANIDPRFAMKYQLSQYTSLKTSFTTMTQFIHKISNTYLDMPTDYWVPTTARLKPMRSYQIAVGGYSQLNKRLFISVEGYYKYSRHLTQYKNWMGLEPPADKWDNDIIAGKGRFYGMEVDLSYKNKRINLDAAYTLSWNERKFNDFYKDWYYDKFDNRHKLNIVCRYRLSNRIYGFASWNYHTGNRLTLPTQYIAFPDIPSGVPGHIPQATYPEEEQTERHGFVYNCPNNVSLPAYHRLDIGVDFRHTTKRGHERIWNISIFNAYCHLNTLYVKVKRNNNGQYYAQTKGFIPIIPSASYTIKF